MTSSATRLEQTQVQANPGSTQTGGKVSTNPSSSSRTIQRGDVVWVNFDPTRGSEIQKTRPAIVISNDSSNRNLNRVQVVPVTSNIGRVYPSETLVTVNGQSNKAMADQIRTVSKERLGRHIGTIGTADMANLETAIKIQLGL